MDSKLVQQLISAKHTYTKVCVEVGKKIEELKKTQNQYSKEMYAAERALEQSLLEEALFQEGLEFCVPGEQFMFRLTGVTPNIRTTADDSEVTGYINYSFQKYRLTSLHYSQGGESFEEGEVKRKLATKEWIPATKENLKEAKKENAVPKMIKIKELKLLWEEPVPESNGNVDRLYLIKADLKRDKWYLVTLRQWRDGPLENKGGTHKITTDRWGQPRWEFRRYYSFSTLGNVQSIAPSTRDGFALEVFEHSV